MGTFHEDKGALHGFTVAVDTDGPELFVGRCDTVTERGVFLLDVDVHVEGEAGSKADYLRRVAAAGHWPRHARIVVPAPRVVSVRKLGEIEF
jgi:hypothetical protein